MSVTPIHDLMSTLLQVKVYSPHGLISLMTSNNFSQAHFSQDLFICIASTKISRLRCILNSLVDIHKQTTVKLFF